MRAITSMLEKHHGVRIMEDAIRDSVKLSSRYITARQLPDKSVSLLDTACARVALSQNSTPAFIENTQRNIAQLESNIFSLERENSTTGNHQDQIIDLKNQKSELKIQLQQGGEQWQHEKKLVKRIHELQLNLDNDFKAQNAPSSDSNQQLLTEINRNEFKSEIIDLFKDLKIVQGQKPMIQINVNSQSVAEVVANWTGIPVGRMVSDEIQSILNLSDQLSKRVIGQKHSLDAITENLKTSRAGLTDPRKPIGVFFMVGSSGVGKTETALALADILYGGEQNLTVINMSEFKEEHKVSMLLGSPPGYVGYGEGGVLTEAVRRKPYSVVLLDEMEKAHPGVQDIFYNLFDKGTIKDGEGRDIDFRNTVIIMTSNAAEEHIRAMCVTQDNYPDPETLLDNFRPQLLNYFKPAFLGRTTLIPYYPLRDDDLMQICKINMNRISQRVQEHYNAEFSYHEDVMLHVVARSQEVDTGARNIENILNRTLLPELATECLSRLSDDQQINQIHVSVSDNGNFSYQLN